MTFLVTVLWAFLSFAHPGMAQPIDPGAFSFGQPTSVQGVHHTKGGLHPMDTSAGGPT